QGTLIGPAQIAVAASIGAAQVCCFARPRVAVLGTGDELVAISETPGPAQIRDSNTPMLAALLRRLGCDVVHIASVPDNPARIAEAIRHGMTHDALFIAGGMSMGEYDYVPRLLVELGVELKITKLRIKPGKPFVFGIGRGRGGEEETGRQGDTGTGRLGEGETGRPAKVLFPQEPVSLSPCPPVSVSPSLSLSPSFIFGLPGNPVSAFVCTLRLASRLLARIAGGKVEERWTTGLLEAALPPNGAREFYQPAARSIMPGRFGDDVATIAPLQWKGSADLFTLASANVLIVRAENEPAIASGSRVRVLEM